VPPTDVVLIFLPPSLASPVARLRLMRVVVLLLLSLTVTVSAIQELVRLGESCENPQVLPDAAGGWVKKINPRDSRLDALAS